MENVSGDEVEKGKVVGVVVVEKRGMGRERNRVVVERTRIMVWCVVRRLVLLLVGYVVVVVVTLEER